MMNPHKSILSKIHFTSSTDARAQNAYKSLVQQYGQVDRNEADCIVVLSGDGFMLKTLQSTLEDNLPIYGMNCGSIGFLLNNYHEDDLYEKINSAECIELHPLKMTAINIDGKKYENLAINEISLLRQRHQAAKIEIKIDEIVRMPELICDGIIVSTPAGSTAYNLSAHGPILPLNSNLLALTPISAFRPRRWKGALLHQNTKIQFNILEPHKRPVSAVADDKEVRHVETVQVEQVQDKTIRILFDKNHTLEERIFQEQFTF